MKSTTVFNNKGGVGKTTLLCNLASYLSLKKNKKVLIIDADPQCNATTYLFSEDELTNIYDKRDGTVYDIIQPLSRGRGYFKGTLPILTTNGFAVDVLAGDPRLALSEDFLAEDWIAARSGGGRGLQTTTLFANLLARCDSYDYVFFDVGPSLGAINRSVLLASNFFLLPMSSDIFSLKAIENISKSLTLWKKGIDIGLSQYFDTEGDRYQVKNKDFNSNLQFLGYVTQQYTAKSVRGDTRPVKAYDRIIKRIPELIRRELITKFTSDQKLNFELGQIPNLHSLVPLSQISNVPIFELKGRHGVVGAHFAKVREFEEIIESVAKAFLRNITSL